MLREICTLQPAARHSLRKLNATAAGLGCQQFDDLAWREPNRLGTDIWSTQSAMLLADWICWKAMLSLGVRPDLIAGHSFGEFPALAAAGSWSLKEALKATRSRCEAVAQCSQAASAMLSVQASRADVERALAERPDEVWLCADNGPDQTVVGGNEAAVTRFAERATQLNWKSRRLSVPCALFTRRYCAIRKVRSTRRCCSARSSRRPSRSSVARRPHSSPIRWSCGRHWSSRWCRLSASPSRCAGCGPLAPKYSWRPARVKCSPS